MWEVTYRGCAGNIEPALLNRTQDAVVHRQIWLGLELQHLPQAFGDAGGAVEAGAGVGGAGHELPLSKRSLKLQHIRRHMGMPPLHTQPLGFPFLPDLLHRTANVLATEEVELPVR